MLTGMLFFLMLTKVLLKICSSQVMVVGGATRGGMQPSGIQQENNTWQRADYMLLGPSDDSTGFSDWLATNVTIALSF
jgi:hypothetical protein